MDSRPAGCLFSYTERIGESLPGFTDPARLALDDIGTATIRTARYALLSCAYAQRRRQEARLALLDPVIKRRGQRSCQEAYAAAAARRDSSSR